MKIQLTEDIVYYLYEFSGPIKKISHFKGEILDVEKKKEDRYRVSHSNRKSYIIKDKCKELDD